MQRVLVIGSGGAGKTTFSAALAQATGLPLINLDALYWRPGWVEPSRADWAETVETLIAQSRWIMDGNYGGTMERRLEACDTVVFLDLPRWLCTWRVLKRWARYFGRSRPEMPEGCPERISLQFLLWVWRYPDERRPGILARLAQLEGGERGRRVIVLRSRREVAEFLTANALRTI